MQKIVNSTIVAILFSIVNFCCKAAKTQQEYFAVNSRLAAYDIIRKVDKPLVGKSYKVYMDSLMKCVTFTYFKFDNSVCSIGTKDVQTEIPLNLPRKWKQRFSYYDLSKFEADTTKAPVIIGYSPLINTGKKDTFLLQRFLYAHATDTCLRWRSVEDMKDTAAYLDWTDAMNGSEIYIDRKIYFHVYTFKFYVRKNKPVLLSRQPISRRYFSKRL